ncbi:hypothetical protein QGN23_05845 [Chryseobacterium gotjawalense]|uniref:DUF4435 domain-containing protein n=1 Tax=Chryseobacterium gotjawalense TaxID=3042315 RepID=A0ABY8RFP1_9FLAO|nr:hypothetical protein [Chryseobacterium sp. wdc7]WHF52798.1 hypothetical protein QGN23_05845 [Chryseobacterium sp. wdc7]
MKCFVIMPFSETSHSVDGKTQVIKSDEWTYIFTEWIKKAVESYKDEKIVCERSKTIQGNFIKGIINDIYNSEIAIVDLTGQKPNVYYELGIRHSLRLGTIIITQDFNALPSDLRSYYCFSYSYSDKSHDYDKFFAEFEKNLHKQIDSLLANINQSDNPVSDFLNLKHYNQVKEKEKQSKILLKIINQLHFHLVYVIGKFKAELTDKEECIQKPKLFFTFLDFGYMDNTISQIFNLEFDSFDSQDIENLQSYYLNFRKELYHIHQYWEGTRVNMGSSNIEKLMERLENFLKTSQQKLDDLESLKKKIITES